MNLWKKKHCSKQLKVYNVCDTWILLKFVCETGSRPSFANAVAGGQYGYKTEAQEVSWAVQL